MDNHPACELYDCECRWCGGHFTSGELSDDCGGCRLSQEQANEYLRRNQEMRAHPMIVVPR